MRKLPIVAIDGPAGSGKSTIAKLLARRLAFVHIDTGALYRTVALQVIRQKVASADDAAVTAVLKSSRIEFRNDGERNRVFLNSEDVSDFIRTEEISQLASKVSALPGVRAGLLGLQRTLGNSGGTVLEGRDIGTVIFPDAEVKIFLNAAVEERARRRSVELAARGQVVSEAQVLREMLERDRNDSSRAHAPLRKAEDAVEVDSTLLSVDQVLDLIERIIHERGYRVRA